MNYFYIDTSSNYLYSGIVSNNNLKVSIKKNFGKELSKYSLDEVKKMFERVNMTPNDIDKIVVVAGPGSFTGIRIGMTIAKTYAFMLKKDIIPITSLEAMAYSINTSLVKVPLIDARRGCVYSGVYIGNSLLLDNQYINFSKLQEYLNTLNQEYVFITNDLKFSEFNKTNYNPDILKIIEIVKERNGVNPHLIEPIYLKLTEAEENIGSNYDN